MSESLKQQVGRAALDYVKDGMRLGIGTGSTAEAFIRALGERVAEGLAIIGVPTSERSKLLCEELNIPLTTLDETPHLDLTIDGAAFDDAVESRHMELHLFEDTGACVGGDMAWGCVGRGQRAFL